MLFLCLSPYIRLFSSLFSDWWENRLAWRKLLASYCYSHAVEIVIATVQQQGGFLSLDDAYP